MMLIFDLDGTLFQAKPVVLQTAELFCRYNGAALPEDKLLYKNADSFLRAVLPDSAELAAARRRYDELLHTAVRERGELYPGIRKTLGTLRREGHEMLVCSASGEEYVRLALQSTGIFEFFTGYFSAESFPSKSELIMTLIKPDVPAAVIGDTHGDIEAAERCGLPSVAVMYGYGNKELLGGADAFACTPEDIIRCIRQIEEMIE